MNVTFDNASIEEQKISEENPLCGSILTRKNIFIILLVISYKYDPQPLPGSSCKFLTWGREPGKGSTVNMGLVQISNIKIHIGH